MTRGAGLFRGAELSRLVLLAVLMVAGWLYVGRYLRSRPASEPPPPASVASGPIVADPSPEFAGLHDKTPLSFRDTSAYKALLERARALDAETLAVRSRHDVLFTHLWERPEKYRGVPIHLLGTARRVLSYESNLGRSGRLHEAWIFTPESQNHPYVCIFEDVPKGFPAGGDVSERVVFNGYFLKLMSYQAGDVPRAAPLLVGRLGWSPVASTSDESGRGPLFWTALAVGAMFLVSFSRWIRQMFRWLSPRSRPDPSRARPSEEIAPEALADWVDSVSDAGTPPPP